MDSIKVKERLKKHKIPLAVFAVLGMFLLSIAMPAHGPTINVRANVSQPADPSFYIQSIRLVEDTAGTPNYLLHEWLMYDNMGEVAEIPYTSAESQSIYVTDIRIDVIVNDVSVFAGSDPTNTYMKIRWTAENYEGWMGWYTVENPGFVSKTLSFNYELPSGGNYWRATDGDFSIEIEFWGTLA